MKVELKAFQEDAARDILSELADARDAVVSKGKPQAVILSAPTGSGKTITVASVIDQLLGGSEGFAARPNTVFLWLSDAPELNVQSANKLLWACDNVPFHRMVPIASDTFNEPRLLPGHVYFINTQLLGKDKRLTGGGDKRAFTFWNTIANTVAAAPDDFILIIDEAHRGASVTERTRTPIMQKFIRGSEEDGMPAVPLVLGMSATPQRFTALLGNTTRTQRPIVISAEDVRSSGLLKDMIIVHNPKKSAVGDLTLLEEAAAKWKHFQDRWETYCRKENERDVVRPILVVQVEDGTDTRLTRTNLADVVRVIERQVGTLGVNEIVHCFQDDGDIQVAGKIIRKIEASRVQASSDVKVVIFKTALSTGWDCPRAEVMMSFRKAKDPTSIAQLVGRMIRTPLARRIGSDEVLDTVELFLPYYDAETLENVLAKLRSPDAEEGISTRVETSASTYTRDPAHAGAFERLQELQTYTIQRVPKMSDIKRALRLSGLLVHEGIDKDVDEALRERMTTRLKELRDVAAGADAKWDEHVARGAEIEVDVTTVSVGSMHVGGRSTVRVALSDENIEQLFDAAGRLLAAGEGLHRSYWKRFHDHASPNDVKRELFYLVRQGDVLESLQKVAREEFDRLWTVHKRAIQKLPPAERERFNLLLQASGHPAPHEWVLPDDIVEKPAGEAYSHHLYTDAAGVFHADLNNWEKDVLDEAMHEEGFVGWLRNLPRRGWAFCVPYELGGTKPFYPDFLFLRKVGKDLEVDVVEPHDDSRSDTWAKAKGLAVFADTFGGEFGRLIICRKVGGKLQKADMNDRTTRERARKMQSQSDLESIFAKP